MSYLLYRSENVGNILGGRRVFLAEVELGPYDVTAAAAIAGGFVEWEYDADHDAFDFFGVDGEVYVAEPIKH